MKKVILMALFLVAAAGSVFSLDGANGWVWSKWADRTTGVVRVVFLKATVEFTTPSLMVVYLPTSHLWTWGLFRSEAWGSGANINVNFRLGGEASQDSPFVLDGGHFYEIIADINKFSDYATVVVGLGPTEQYHYSLSGLSKTIDMAGAGK